MLSGSLGPLLIDEARKSTRFIDLFAGSGAVGTYVSEAVAVPVLCVDLLGFSSALSGSVIRRTTPLDGTALINAWVSRARVRAKSFEAVLKAAHILSESSSPTAVADARKLCAEAAPEIGFIWADYGGHYFSAVQAFWLSMLRATIPERSPQRAVALSALIRTASKCSASPGHTAQPFQPTARLLPHIRTAWRRDVLAQVELEVALIAPRHALVRGGSRTGDAQDFAASGLRAGDLVFCDPPYSEAQYSRFYHVLEGIYRNGWPSVHGAGRAPEGTLRPSSSFSTKSMASQAMTKLLTSIHRAGSTAVFTYPEGERSNGLQTSDIDDVAGHLFDVATVRIPMSHSTLGGSSLESSFRRGRNNIDEIVYVLRAKS